MPPNLTRTTPTKAREKSKESLLNRWQKEREKELGKSAQKKQKDKSESSTTTSTNNTLTT